MSDETGQSNSAGAGSVADVVVSSMERVFRFVITGFVVVVGYQYFTSGSLPDEFFKNVGVNELLFCTVACGMMWYGVHRLLLWVVFGRVEHWLLKKEKQAGEKKKGKGKKKELPVEGSYWEDLGSFFVRRQRFPNTLARYLHFRWAIVHYCCILGEVLLVFSIFIHEAGAESGFALWRIGAAAGGLLLIALSLWHHCQLTFAEREICRSEYP